MSTNDPSTSNTDAENTSAMTPSKSTAETQYPEPDEAEKKRVGKWHETIKVSRAFDEEIRKLYARDRKYCRAESSLKVQYSLVQAYIDILVAFLVARDPDFESTPADSVGQAGLENAELYGKTMEIIISHLLRSARIKRKAGRQVRSALSVGIGVLKASWQEIWDTDPHIKEGLNDAQQNMAQIKELIARIAAGEEPDEEEAMLRLNEMQNGLAANSERMVASGMGLSNINPEDMAYSLDCDSVMDFESSSWIANRYFLHTDVAKSDFQIDPKKIDAAQKYSPRKPGDSKDPNKSGMATSMDPSDADSYVKGSSGDTQLFVCCWEVWDGEANQFLTLIEGVNCYAEKPQQPPCPTTRFYPYFMLSFTEVDGERHPQSLTQRSAHLQDEIERAMTNFTEHRARVKPKIFFDETRLSVASIKKIKAGVTGEYIGIKTIGGAEVDLNKVLAIPKYPTIDGGLYDTSPYVRAMETVWGIQEALSSTVQVAKTATEADIQQAGTQAKTGYKRDVLEEMLTDLGQYTGEIASFKIDLEQAQRIAGPGAYWIPSASVEDLQSMLTINVRAGSSGKPDSEARRAAWGAIQPQIKEMMLLVANLRQTTPPQLADNIEELLIETAERLGENIDSKRFIPQAPEQPVLNPMTGQPMSNDELGMQQQAAQAQAEGGEPGGDGPPPPGPDGQQQLAPTDIPVAITGP